MLRLCCGFFLYLYSHYNKQTLVNTLCFLIASSLTILLTRCLNTVYECFHLLVTLGLICIEVGTSTNNPSTPVPELTMGFVLLLTVIRIWSEKKVTLAAWHGKRYFHYKLKPFFLPTEFLYFEILLLKKADWTLNVSITSVSMR